MPASNLRETGVQRQFSRSIPPRLAPIVECLELVQPHIVTLADIKAHLHELGMTTDPAVVAGDLQKNGWLLALRTRGSWEFAPGARAGAINSGDPFIELRATLQRRPLPVALAYDSAAWLHGLSARQPEKHVLATRPSQRKLPAALNDFRITRIWGALDVQEKGELPIWRIETLLAKMAIVPHYYRDWPNVMEWLKEAFERTEAGNLERELDSASDPAWIRLAYLAERATLRNLARDLMRNVQHDKGPVYLGRNRSRGHYVREYDIIDSLLIPSVKT
jgi:predicted transcriptional regulator of viral defense system